MDISKLSDIEYKYIFSVDNIDSVIDFNKQRYNEIINIDFIEDKNKQKLIELSEDFENLAIKLKSKQNIKSTDNFNYTHKALTICNAKISDYLIQEEINNKRYERFIKKNKSIDKKINCFEDINFKLGNINYLEVKINNWFTIIFILFLILFFLILLIISYINQKNLDTFMFSILSAILVIIFFIKKEKLNKMIKRDYIRRLISKNEYVLSKTQEKYDQHIFNSTKNIIERKL